MPDLRVHGAADGLVARDGEGPNHLLRALSWDAVFRAADPAALIRDGLRSGEPLEDPGDPITLPPLESQEVWAAGVTWERSRTARMEESAQAGGSNFYDLVYEADRPELFLKATPHRVVGHGQPMTLRSDSRWIVPEPELTVAVTAEGRIFGYTIGNDLSCRDIEGANPLYLPQAKVFAACAAVGPGLVIRDEPLPRESVIHMEIHRDGAAVFQGEAPLSRLKRSPEDLVSWLYRHNRFPDGCLLMTGTGIVPPDEFCLKDADEVRIAIDGIGELRNPMGGA